MTSPTTRVVVASYERVSTMLQGSEGFGLDWMDRVIDDYVARHPHWTLPAHLRFRDGETDDASGKLYDLPGLLAALAAAKRGEFTLLVCPRVDRFSRDLEKAIHFENQFERYGVRVVYPQFGDGDRPLSSTEKLIKRTLQNFAEFDYDEIIAKTTNGRREKARRGMVVGANVAPFGYRFDKEHLSDERQRTTALIQHPENARHVRTLLFMLITHSAQRVVEWANAEAIPSPRGGPWYAGTIMVMLRQTAYVGVWRYNQKDRRRGAALEEGAFAVKVANPIFTEAEWEMIHKAVDRRRFNKARKEPRTEPDPYVLRGHMVCGHCGSDLWCYTSKGTRYYLCPNKRKQFSERFGNPPCGLWAVYGPDLERAAKRDLIEAITEGHVEDALRALVAEHDASGGLLGDGLDENAKRAEKLRRKLARMNVDIYDEETDEITREVLIEQRDKTAKEIAGLGRARETLLSTRTAGMAPEQATSLRVAMATLRANLERASADEAAEYYAPQWSEGFDALEVKGRVYLDDSGELFGRLHRYRIEWEGLIPLSHNYDLVKYMSSLGGHQRLRYAWRTHPDAPGPAFLAAD